MKSKKIFVVLGADNVGKTTMINESMKFAKEVLNKKVSYKHFSAPKPGQSAIDMYMEALVDLSLEQAQYIYLDRAWPESKFYEKVRRNNSIPIEDCLEVEQAYVDLAENYGYQLSVNLMHKPWLFIEQFHRRELQYDVGFVQESALKNQEPTGLNERHKEFNLYYDFMSKYSSDREILAPHIVKNFPWNVLQIRDLEFVLV